MKTYQGRSGKRLVADINVTPLVDVMLVLLIIFMITAPMMTQGINVDLPQTTARALRTQGINVDLPQTTARALRQGDDQVIITINEKGELSIKDIPVNKDLFFSELEKFYKIDNEQTIYLKADKKVNYGTVVQVMADIKNAGFEKIGIMTKPPEKK